MTSSDEVAGSGILAAVANADVAPDAVGHFKSKLDVENHLKASGLNFSILRPVAFFENYDVDTCVEIKFQAPHAIDATSFPWLRPLDGVESPGHRR